MLYRSNFDINTLYQAFSEQQKKIIFRHFIQFKSADIAEIKNSEKFVFLI